MSDNIRVLVAEDQDYNRLLIRRILEIHDFTIVEAENGVRALESMRQAPCDIVLLDIMMPEMDGLGVCRELRKNHSPSELPILMITAMSDEQDLIQGFAAGASDYITKPIIPDILLARVNAHLQSLLATRALIESQKTIAAQKRMETVGLFAAGVAHNFNNLLGTIMGSAAILEMSAASTPANESSASALRLISDAAKKGAELTKALLTFAKPSTRDHCVEPGKIIEASVPLMMSVTGHRIQFSVDLPNELPAVAISPLDLSQVLLELLQNSADAIAAEGKITVSAHNSKHEPNLVEFVITDSGKGIDKNVVDKVFEPFWSTKNIDHNIKIALDGSGLGLSSAYNIIQQYGGRIEVSNTSAAGTTIKFTVPRCKDVSE